MRRRLQPAQQFLELFMTNLADSGYVLGLLRRILSSLGEIDAINNGRKVPWDAETTSETDGSDDESEADEGCSTTELQQLATSIADIITDLMQLSSTIRNPAPHDLFKRSGNIDTSYYEEFDIQHVKGKFPEAEQYLITRMGRAISRRRQYLRYREEHRARLAEALDTTDTSAKKVASTVASSIPAQLKSGFQAVELEDDDEFVDHASQTSYASSMSGATALRPPPLPQEGREGKPFECSLCHYFTVVDVGTDWQKHVYRDLQPYVCTFENCTSADRTYESRREWFSHELQEHRQVWNCIEGCQQSFRSQNQFQAHLKHSHTQSIADRGMSGQSTATLTSTGKNLLSRSNALSAGRVFWVRHFTSGDTLQNSQPDPHLCYHLWQKRLIDDHDLKLLKGIKPFYLVAIKTIRSETGQVDTDSLAYDDPNLYRAMGRKLGHANSEAPSGGYTIPLSEATQADSPGAISNSDYEMSQDPHSNPDSESAFDASDSLPGVPLEAMQSSISAKRSTPIPTEMFESLFDFHQGRIDPNHLNVMSGAGQFDRTGRNTMRTPNKVSPPSSVVSVASTDTWTPMFLGLILVEQRCIASALKQLIGHIACIGRGGSSNADEESD
ncbi:hypothetical protein EKO04_009157 [Ascochyta lentis]|uniref:C2H2-type domain-containing protein n=1 Tax=Ascochyta lentis TaxID=205686 RepID=A0A8H7IYA9_9PLEO|nr:hypothetical protein EKO04_009157 [Ascochyta lentis]